MTGLPASDGARRSRPLPEIVAEIGTAHAGQVVNAERLIAESAAAGADSIKSQIIFADEIIHPAARARIGGRTVRLHGRFRALERPFSFYRALAAYCRHQHIDFFVSVFGVRSLRYALDLDCARIKIASPELNHIPLLEAVARTAVAVVLSSGVSYLSDIERALDVLGRDRTTLLHCVTSYPAVPTDYNLRLLPHYAALFALPVGVSDHSVDPVLVPSIATHYGAVMIEKHVQLAVGPSHLDSAVAITPPELARLVATVSRLRRLRPTLRYRRLHAAHGRPLVARVAGDGAKRLTAAEQRLYATTNRSIRATVDIAVGARLGTANCAVLRGESGGAGLSPACWRDIDGAIARRPIAAGRGIVWPDIIG